MNGDVGRAARAPIADGCTQLVEIARLGRLAGLELVAQVHAEPDVFGRLAHALLAGVEDARVNREPLHCRILRRGWRHQRERPRQSRRRNPQHSLVHHTEPSLYGDVCPR